MNEVLILARDIVRSAAAEASTMAQRLKEATDMLDAEIKRLSKPQEKETKKIK